jgi:hypothetical protein
VATEFEKLVAVKDQSQAIGEFLEALADQGILLCKFRRGVGEWVPEHIPVNERLAAYFHIDLDKLEAERMAALNEFVASQQAKDNPQTV